MSEQSLLAAIAERLEMALNGETVAPLPQDPSRPANEQAAVAAANRALEAVACRRPHQARPAATTTALPEDTRTEPLGAHHYVLQEDGRLVFEGGDAAADAILGLDHSALVGQSLEEAFPDLAAGNVPGIYREIARGALPQHLELVTYDDGFVSGVFDVVACNSGPGRVTAFFRDITAENAAVVALERSQVRLQSTFQAAPVAVALCRDRTLREVNPYLCEFTGYSRDDLLGAPCARLYPTAEEFERVWQSARQQLRTNPVAAVETQWLRRDGALIDVTLSLAAGASIEGQVEMVFAALDVTASKRVLQALRASEERNRVLIESSPDGVAMVSPQGRILAANPGMAALHGYASSEELVGTDIAALVPSEERSRMWAAAGRVAREHHPQRLDTRLLRRDGTACEGEISLAGIWDEGGALVAMIGVARDITERKRAEQALRASEQRFREMADLLPEVVFEADCDGLVQFANRQAFNALGYSPEDLLGGVHLMQVVAPEERTMACERLQRRLQGEELPSREYTMVRKDGSTYPGRLQVTRVVREGEVVGLRGLVIDVSESKQLADELAASRRTAWALLNAVPAAAMLVDPCGIVIAGNAAAARELGVTLAELPGMSLLDGVREELAQQALERLQRVAETRSPETFESSRGGRTFVTSIHPLSDSDGAVTSLASFVLEVSDQRRAEQSLRLATVGELAAGVAHEFNNLLCAIWMNADLANSRRSPETYAAAYESIRDATRRGSSICDNLLSFARPVTPVRTVMPAEAPLEFALSLARPQLGGAGITVERDFAPGLAVCVDRSQFEQVYLNLIINACHAMPEGGTLRLSTRALPAESERPIVVRVADTGCGIAPENLSRIFDPFFTTKGSDSNTSGTGLGLAVSRSIVTAHDGDIQVTSVPGEGTCFELHLPAQSRPLADDAPAAEGAELLAQVGALSGLRVLIAEDESAIRETAAEFLRAQGLQATTAADASEALRVLAQAEQDVVVTDLMMPGGGLSVLRALAGVPGRPAVIVVTGKLSAGLEADLLRAGADLVLGKPFGPLELLAAIGRLRGPA